MFELGDMPHENNCPKESPVLIVVLSCADSCSPFLDFCTSGVIGQLDKCADGKLVKVITIGVQWYGSKKRQLTHRIRATVVDYWYIWIGLNNLSWDAV